MKQRFNSFAELSRHKKEGEHYSIIVQEKSGSDIAIVAPHGGFIEHHTSEIARKIASNDHNLYIFESLERKDSFFELHIESTRFEEPRCMELVSKTDTVLTIHGCQEEEPVIYLGGKDEKMKSSLAEAFNKNGIKAVTENHAYPGKSPQNICNKNKRAQGVQLEFSKGIRDNPELTDKCVDIIRKHLKS